MARRISTLKQLEWTVGAIVAALVVRRAERLVDPAKLANLAADSLTAATTAAAAQPPMLLAFAAAAAFLLLAALVLLLRSRSRTPVYVVDFSVFSPPAEWTFKRSDVGRLASSNPNVHPDDVGFMERLAFRSGLGDATAVPPSIQANPTSKPGIEAARAEYAEACFACVEALLQKTGVDPSKIKYVITNSSLFNPTPSLSAAVINRFKLRDDVVNYSLGGMGCSAGVVALDLARSLLERHPEGKLALVVSHENISNAYYTGRNKGMQVPNTLFRSNGAAVLVSSRASDASRAKYSLKHVVRTIMAADDEAYGCVWQTNDAEGHDGVDLKKELIGVAGRAVARNLARLGPLVLPWSEQLKFASRAALLAAVKALPPSTAASLRRHGLLPSSWANAKPYTPDFAKAFDAVCIHTGGRGVIDSMETNLGMPKAMLEASRASLYRFGNTSSCSVWYELAYHESQGGGLAKGSRVWQLAFGSGFKCNSAVLVANRRVSDAHPCWAGFDAAKMYAQLAAVDAEVAASRARRASDASSASSSEGGH